MTMERNVTNIFYTQVSWSESLKIEENFKLQWKNTKSCSTGFGHFSMIVNKL